ncbi:TIGR02391 family protein [Methanoregula formicica]|uniref:TIGR02391 family protein n=1 Tax=Methanoregula formicica (strain DSM 22288 / NBRC 105244 / SMSP) TaxID=593750 RepID=L0HJQ1_METFS|nr:TIGR02391 family protein [Methanoregula formicica]AGB03294.1 TIGR02391 family protein [Methanoregula formicica SMSP]
MIDEYFEINKSLREIREKSVDALVKILSGDTASASLINIYIKRDQEKLERLLRERNFTLDTAKLNRHIRFGKEHDYRDILLEDIPQIEEILDKKLRDELKIEKSGFKNFLHPIIQRHAYDLFQNGDYRNAVLNSIIGIFDQIREKTGLEDDGDKLITQALSIQNPLLVLSDLNTDSGRNDQKGFLLIFQGAYIGIRNPKAHTLEHDLTEKKAAQYLIFASLLARRIDEATLVKKE